MSEEEKFHLIMRRYIRLNPTAKTASDLVSALLKDITWKTQMKEALSPLQGLWKEEADDVA